MAKPKPDEPMVQLSIKVPPSLMEKIKQDAKNEGYSNYTEYVRRTLAQKGK